METITYFHTTLWMMAFFATIVCTWELEVCDQFCFGNKYCFVVFFSCFCFCCFVFCCLSFSFL